MKHARLDYNRIQDPEKLIPEDEPVFLLRGQDIAAPEALRFWAVYNAHGGGSLEASRLALKWAVHMEDWQRMHAQKACDLPDDPKRGMS